MSAKKLDDGPQEEKPIRYTKDQLVRSMLYKERKDLLQALLKPDRLYSYTEVDEVLNKYRKGKVN